MESVLLDQFGCECDAEEAVGQTSFSDELAEGEKGQQGVRLRLGELLSARVDITGLLAVRLKADAGTIEA